MNNLCLNYLKLVTLRKKVNDVLEEALFDFGSDNFYINR